MSRFKLIFFSPRSETQVILSKIFQRLPEVVGKIGEYKYCAFVSPGTGQFLPSEASNPTIGKPGSMEFVEEDRVEIIVNDSGERHELKQAIVELKSAHPYEEVAYDVYKLEDI